MRACCSLTVPKSSFVQMIHLQAGSQFTDRLTQGMAPEQAIAALRAELIESRAELNMIRTLTAPMLLLGTMQCSRCMLSQVVMDDAGASSSSYQPPWPIE